MRVIRNAIVRYEFKTYLTPAFMDLCARVCILCILIYIKKKKTKNLCFVIIVHCAQIGIPPN